MISGADPESGATVPPPSLSAEVTGVPARAGALRWIAELAMRPIGEWTLLFSPKLHTFLPLASALPAIALTAVFFGVRSPTSRAARATTRQEGAAPRWGPRRTGSSRVRASSRRARQLRLVEGEGEPERRSLAAVARDADRAA